MNYTHTHIKNPVWFSHVSRGACPPIGGTAHQPTLTARRWRLDARMPGPAKHPSLRHPRTIRYVQPRPPSARRLSHPTPYPELAQSA
eukprot:scaffold25803_cov129-Isochrysis_galbana.AAC.3